jgi:sugar lactone lactonase YvrE
VSKSPQAVRSRIRFGAIVGPVDSILHRGEAAPAQHLRSGHSFLATVLFAACALAVIASPASAAVVHHYRSQITEAGGAPLGNPQGLGVDSAGNLYVSDGANRVLDKYNSSGNPVSAWGTDGRLSEADGAALTEPFGLAVDGADDLWLSDVGPGLIDKFDPAAGFLDQGDGEGHWTGEFTDSIAYSDASEHLYVADSEADDLWVLDSSAGFDSDIVEGPGAEFGNGCCFIHVAADNSAAAGGGDLYVAGGQGATRGVYRIEAEGGPAGEALGAPFSATAPYIDGARLSGTPLGPFGEPGGVAVDSAGNLYVLDTSTNVVDEFGPDGRFLDAITGTPTGPGGALVPFTAVSAVGVGPASGSLYVADAGSAAVDVFGPGLPFPEVNTSAATAVTTTTATLHGEVDPVGFEVEECVFEYGETTAYGQSAPCETEGGGPIGSGTGPVPVHADLTGLRPGATFHFRLLATNENGTETESGDQSFFTGAGIDALSVVGVSATTATLETSLNPHGQATSYRFEYDTAPYAEGGSPHGITLPVPAGSAGSGEADVIRSVALGALAPSTVYHYRVIAENSLGVVASPDHSFTTQGAAASSLPDGRAWELVSPPDKHGSPLEPITEEGGVIQAAAGGGGLAYVAKGPLETRPPGVRSPQNTQLIATRGAAGWSTVDATTPREELVTFLAGAPSEYELFAEDLSSGLVEPLGATPLSPQTTERTPYRREADGSYVPLLTESNVPAGVKFGGEEERANGAGQFTGGAKVITASPDLRHVILQSPQPLAAGFAPGFESNGRTNIFELSGGVLTLVSILPGNETTSEAELEAGLGAEGRDVRNAISENGDRVVFEANEGARRDLYLRDIGLGKTLQLDEPQPGSLEGPARAVFQGAGRDDSKVFFTDTERLTEDATANPGEPDLYMCEVQEVAGGLHCDLSDLTVGPDPGEAADVQGTVSAVDATGSQVFFAADGVLTHLADAEGEHAVPGDCASPAGGTCNLYDYDTSTGETTLVAVLSSRDDPDWLGPTRLHELGNLTARVSPDGRWFTFMSERPLTGYDNRDADSEKPDAEVFLFGTAGGTLSCVSCNPTGARPLGLFDELSFPGLLVDRPASWRERWIAASIPGWTLQSLNFAEYQSRYLSDSGRLFFNSSDALVPQDSNGLMDVYEYEPPGVGDCTTSSPTYGPGSGGCVALISAGTSGEESAFLDASESGEDAFFLTASKLSPADTDAALDVYDAHVCSAASPCLGAPPAAAGPCQGEACQPTAGAPGEPPAATSSFVGPGNPAARCPKGEVLRGGATKQSNSASSARGAKTKPSYGGGKCVKKHQHKKPKKKKKHQSAKKKSGKRGKTQKSGQPKGHKRGAQK